MGSPAAVIAGGGGGGGITSPLDVDNIRIEDNTISSINTNGNIIVDPDGAGITSVQSSLEVAVGTGHIRTLDDGGDEKSRIGNADWDLASDVHIRWSNNVDVPSGAADAGVKRSGAGVLQVTNGGAGSGSIVAGTARLDPTTVLFPSGTSTVPGIAPAGAPDTGISWPGGGALSFLFDGVRRMYMQADRFSIERDDGIITLGASNTWGVCWAADAVARITAGTSGLGALRLGQEVQARTADLALTTAESGILYTNTGASGQVIFTLPAATLTNNVGACYGFCVRAAQNIRITAGAGDVINRASGATAAGGNISSNTVRSMIWLTVSGAGFWDAVTETGTWT